MESINYNPFWKTLPGWSLFPLIKNRKRPAVTWTEFMFARANPLQLDDWANQFAGLGVVTGTISGLVVVDIDNDDAFLWCEARGLPSTVTIKTPRGYHLYYAHPGIVISNSASKLTDGVDIRGDGGFVVGPGSYFIPTKKEIAEGKVEGEYWPVGTMGPGDIPLAPLPQWIIDHLTVPTPDAEPVQARQTPQMVDVTETAEIPAAYAAAVFRGEIDRVTSAGNGTRNQSLFMASDRIARLIASGAIDQREAEAELKNAGSLIGLTSDEIGNTIKSGFRHGLSKPKMLETTAPKMSAAMARKLLKKSKGNN